MKWKRLCFHVQSCVHTVRMFPVFLLVWGTCVYGHLYMRVCRSGVYLRRPPVASSVLWRQGLTLNLKFTHLASEDVLGSVDHPLPSAGVMDIPPGPMVAVGI